MNAPTDPASEPPGYAQALDELDRILRELEGTDVDVDRLAERVARATELIAVCRRRIGDARLRIDEVIADLDNVDGHDNRDTRDPHETPGGTPASGPSGGDRTRQ